jgi:hypothetical protein
VYKRQLLHKVVSMLLKTIKTMGIAYIDYFMTPLKVAIIVQKKQMYIA